ncbi:DUF2059 domain-containing protein [Aliisedimentitalea scapharcae]|uniref:DUF2059 domain-containing protein n=1 Tax=Aliisedimentitalea scapharcae TaxID=1524259 RepID=A0ABZ2XR03_9RHOB
MGKVFRWVRTTFMIVCFLGTSLQVSAQQDNGSLSDGLRLAELAEMLRTEGIAYGAAIDQDMMGGQGGRTWQSQVAAIYDVDRIVSTVADALEAGLSRSERQDILAFFGTPLGQRILTLEYDAREIMAQTELADQLILDLSDRAHDKDARYVVIREFVTVNDLVALNVSGALNANYHFLVSFARQGGNGVPEDDILADVWAEADEIEHSISDWIYAYLLLAYDPLRDTEMEQYLAFSQTASGQALNRVLFAGFETLYNAINRDLGAAAARAMETQDL